MTLNSKVKIKTEITTRDGPLHGDNDLYNKWKESVHKLQVLRSVHPQHV